GPGAANGANISSFSVTPTNSPACVVAILSPAAFPFSLGNIAPGGSVQTSATMSFTNCAPNAKFRVDIELRANGGAATGAIVDASMPR
ncbi:MAG TPA: hypothetical protein VGH38_18655, partial [Bryobacteraceae bacterium]